MSHASQQFIYDKAYSCHVSQNSIFTSVIGRLLSKQCLDTNGLVLCQKQVVSATAEQASADYQHTLYKKRKILQLVAK